MRCKASLVPSMHPTIPVKIKAWFSSFCHALIPDLKSLEWISPGIISAKSLSRIVSGLGASSSRQAKEEEEEEEGGEEEKKKKKKKRYVPSECIHVSIKLKK